MPPSEESILSNFLLSPAPLPTVMSLQQFTDLFPRRLRSNPQVRSLYRELQQAREQDIDLVNENIDQELKRGEEQKAELRMATSKNGRVEGMDENERREINIDMQLFDSSTHDTSCFDRYHSLSSLVAEMEAACDDIEREIDGVDEKADELLADLNSTVGGLSDLRYGKFQDSAGRTAEEVVDEAFEGLENLEDACNRNGAS